jgi:hypothetical protein
MLIRPVGNVCAADYCRRMTETYLAQSPVTDALFVSFARAHGIPARTRVEFAGYFMPGWWLDHVVGEIWDAVDPKLVGSWLRNEPLRIPEELTSYSPTSGPLQVTLRPGLAT